MRNEPIGAYRVRVEKFKEIFKIKEGLSKPSIDKTRKQFCIHGHDTFVTGRHKRGECCECERIRGREYAHTHKKQAKKLYQRNRKQYNAQATKWQKEHRKYVSAYHSLYEQLNWKRVYKHKKAYYLKTRTKWLQYQRNWRKAQKRKGLKAH